MEQDLQTREDCDLPPLDVYADIEAEMLSGAAQQRELGKSSVLFCYLDEAGDFDFSATGTRFFLYTALVVDDPLPVSNDLMRARYRLLLNDRPFSKSHGANDFFHATEDSEETRELVFGTLSAHLDSLRAYSVVIQKNKTNPSIRDQKSFFELVMNRLLAEVAESEDVMHRYEHVCVLTDTLPVHKKRSAVIGTAKATLKALLAESGVTHSMRPVASKSELGLQAADYFSWALFRKWERDDTAPYEIVGGAVRREVDYFAYGDTVYALE